MNKKIFLIILLAIIVAFISAFLLVKGKNISPELELETTNNTPVIIEESIKTTETESLSITKEDKEEKTKENIVQTTVKKEMTAIEKPVIIPLKVEETPQATHLEGTVAEETVDYGIYKEDGTNNIVITRNFSSKSPKRYSFKGFGFLDKVIE